MIIMSFCYLLFIVGGKNLFSQTSQDFVHWDKIQHEYSWHDKRVKLDEIYDKIKNERSLNQYPAYYRRLGILFKEAGILDSAQYAFSSAEKYNLRTNDFFSAGSNINSIGVIQYELGDLQTALKYFLKAHELYKKAYYTLPKEDRDYSFLGQAESGGNISEIYSKIDSFQLAIQYAKLSIEARYKCPDRSKIGRDFYVLGLVYELQKTTDSAIKYYTTAFENTEKTNDISNSIQILNGLGRTYFIIKKYNTSIAYFNKALDTAYKYQNRPLLAETYGYLANAYQARGDTLQAYKYLKLESVLKDDLLDDNKVKAIIAAERKYDSQAKTSKITEQANQIKIKNLWLVIIAIISISILVIAFLLIRGYRNRQRIAQKEIDEQRRRVDDLMQKQEVENVNAMLKGQDEERKRIAQELHDRIGSILSTVKLHFTNVEAGIALLKEQQNKSYTEAVGLLDEAVDEVRRISHDLYEGSLAKFGFKTALLQLITAIEKANIVRVTFMDNGVERDIYMEFEQDLYRITQELLSNSLKYAHAKEISIQLNEKQGVLEFMYEDDGVGFNSQKIQTSAGIGYKNIAARVAKMGGSWHLDALPNHGMTLIIELPIDYGKD